MSFIDDYVAYAEQGTDAPRIYHRYLAYLAVGCTLADTTYLRFGHHEIYPNMYMLILGPSTAFHKTTSVDVTAKMLAKVSPKIRLPNDFSDESLINILRKQKSGLVYEGEFSNLLLQFEKKYASKTKVILTDIYGCPRAYPVPYRMKTPDDDMEIIERPVISIASTSTIDWLIEASRVGDMRGGFLSRFVYVVANRKERHMPIPNTPDENFENSLADRLRRLRNPAVWPGGSIHLSDSAKECYIAWNRAFDTIQTAVEKELDSAINRLKTTALKFAMINAALRLDHVVNGPDMESAVSMADESRRAVMEAMGAISDKEVESKFSKITNAMTDYLLSNGEVSRRKLLRKFKIKLPFFNSILEYLKTTGEIEVYVDRNGSTKIRYMSNVQE